MAIKISNTTVIDDSRNLTNIANVGVSGVSTISVNSSSDALRITQLGTGNALVVEDETNPDSTPFVVNASGAVGVGTTAPAYSVHIEDNLSTSGGIFVESNSISLSSPIVRVRGVRSDTNTSQCFSGQLVLEKYQISGATSNGRNLGAIIFGGNYSTTPGITTGITYGASIGAMADGTFSDINTAPTAIVFNTGSVGLGTLGLANVNYGTEAARITSNRNLLIGSSSETGTASQRLQVTGGAYVSGNLGVGATNPTVKLDVAGDIRLSAADAEIEFNTGGARLKGRLNALSIHTGGGLDSEASEQVRINTTGVGIGTTNPVGQLQVSSGPVIIGAATSTGSADQRLQVSGHAYVSGSVGIGTTNPVDKLHVTDSVGEVATFESTTTEVSLRLKNSTAGNVYLFNKDSNNFAIRCGGAAGSETLRVTSTSVGIGTTNPNGILQVGAASTQAFVINSVGQLLIGGAATSNDSPLVIRSVGAAATPAPQILLSPTTGTNQSVIQFANNGSASFFVGRTSSTGNVTSQNGSTAISGLNNGSYADFVGNAGNLPLLFLTNSTEAMRIDSSQRVGIGSTNPTATLTIGTVGVASDGKSQIYLNGTTSNRIDFAQAGVAGPAIIGTSGTTRSVGTKIVLNPGSAAAADYAFGIQSNTLWSSVPSSSQSYLWYAGTVGIATLSGAGALSLSGGLTIGTNSNIVADFSNATLISRTYFITNTTNGSTVVGAIPNGTNATTGFLAFNNSTPTNATYCGVVAGATGGFLRVATTGTGAYLPLNIETNNVTQVAISTGGEVTFTKGITVSAGIATIPTVSVTATTASTTTTTGALTVAGGVGIAASVNAGGDVDGRRFGSNTATVTMSGTPANIATIAATGAVGLVTFATAGIAATVNVTGMIAGQVLNLFITNPTTAKVLTIQYNGTAIAGSGIATASPAQGTSFALNTTKYYRFMAMTDGVPVAGDIRVAAV